MKQNKIRVIGDIALIELYNRRGDVVEEAMIDAEDIDKVRGHRLHISTAHNRRYRRVVTNDNVSLHNLIVGKPPEGKIVDHADTDTMNNRKYNLRIINLSESGMNRSKSANRTSKYKGVSWAKSKQKWLVYIRVNKNNTYIGKFDRENTAGRMYNQFAKKYFGEYAKLNIIEEN